jgi:oligoribonuclease NrnB/cAMP/cGMP phosphodiesterase (DHH superfamily)
MSYQPDIMLYHANCADGFGAAWAAWTLWGDAVEYRPVSYGQEPPDVAGKHVLIGDFSYKRDTLQAMGKTARSIIVLDHHQTAAADLADWTIDDAAGEFWVGDDPLKAVHRNDEFIGQPIAALFDMERSGARMVWEFCHEQQTPRLIELIEDRDLWRFTFEETKPFGLWLRSEPFDFEKWTTISDFLATDATAILAEARAMQRFFDQKVSEIAGLSRMGLLAGKMVPLCNCPPMFASEVGHKLLDDFPDAPFAACYSDQGKSRGYSLRSRDDRADVSEIASKFGGGGHRNAAGFGVPLP